MQRRFALAGFAHEGVALRRIDDGHDGAEAERLPAERYWDLELPRGGVALLEATDTAAQTAPAAPAGAVRRVRHRYTARTTSAWADLEEATTTFRLGTATDPHAVPVITADLEDCGETITVTGRLTDAGAAWLSAAPPSWRPRLADRVAALPEEDDDAPTGVARLLKDFA